MEEEPHLGFFFKYYIVVDVVADYCIPI